LKGNRLTGGFTLLELSVVILLLGFILLLTFPNFRDFIGPRDIKKAVLGLVGTVRYAQSQAATTKQRHRLNLDIKENAYWVSKEVGKGKFVRDGTPKGQANNLPPGVWVMDFVHPGRGKVQEGTVHVEFSPTGWAEECSIHIQKGEGEAFTLFIHPLGGKVDLVSGYVERTKG
jgi:prepilin-type N-terminal cleavage/methylation domain-containing protein